MRVLITDKINQKAVDIVSAVAEVDNLPTMSEDELVEVIGKYDALLVRSQTKVTEKIINAASNMKIIGLFFTIQELLQLTTGFQRCMMRKFHVHTVMQISISMTYQCSQDIAQVGA